ncbi:MAG: hypothetical protein WD851_16875 [Pirellulales bacterium]
MRRQDEEEEAVGQDSFLDVVANIVGILILLVMVVGARAALTPVSAKDEPAKLAGPGAAELKAAVHQAAKSRADVEEIIQRTANMHLESVRRDSERMRLQTLVSAVSAEIERQRKDLSAEEQQDFDLRRQLAEANIKLEDLSRRELGMIDVTSEVEQVKSLPTPLAETVSGDEVHLRLASGHVAFIPLDQLLEAFQTDAKQNLWRLDNQTEASNTIGPIGDFRLRYFLRKTQLAVPGRGTATLVQLARWQLVPTSAQIGEPVEQSLMEGSELFARLARFAPERTTITIWVYPDSFPQFRAMKEALFQRGYATAARPLPAGIPIGGSPSGTKSSAQ